MPNPQMRDARERAMAAPPKPTPVFTTDQNGSRIGERPTVGPAPAAAIHAALKTQDAIAATPRPTAQETIGAQSAGDSADSSTRDLSLGTAASRIQARAGRINQAIDDASQ